MVYANFLYFILAIAVFSIAPDTYNHRVSFWMNFSFCMILIISFILFNRYQFRYLKRKLDKGHTDIAHAKSSFTRMVNLYLMLGVVLFSIEVYTLELKGFLATYLTVWGLKSVVNLVGLGIFLLHLSIVWYWAYRAMEDTLHLGNSVWDYIRSNIKFNLVIVIPWVLFSILRDVTALLLPGIFPNIDESLIFFILFLGLFSVFAPVLVTRLWDCKPLEDREFLKDIRKFIDTQGVKFKSIMSWNALNGGLVTAGVMGLIYPFRYLLITPELMSLLNRQEMMGVICHEVGHVKKKHMFFYLLIFGGFVILGSWITGWMISLLIRLFPLQMIRWLSNGYIFVIFSLLILILYFRFIFGYFMRIFERQADLYCFECGIDPHYLITSFMKLGVHFGDDGKKSNWHHYNISQRIEYLRKCEQNPQEVVRHRKKVNYSVLAFSVILIILTFVSFVAPDNMNIALTEALNVYSKDTLTRIEKTLIDRIGYEPNNPELQMLLGEFSYRMEKWKQAQTAYEKSLELDYGQPEVLNNLAWLYLTCPDKTILNPERALKLASDALKMRESFQVLDTQAEAYFQLGKYKEAYNASKRAYEITSENRSYYLEQMKKMESYMKRLEKR